MSNLQFIFTLNVYRYFHTDNCLLCNNTEATALLLLWLVLLLNVRQFARNTIILWIFNCHFTLYVEYNQRKLSGIFPIEYKCHFGRFSIIIIADSQCNNLIYCAEIRYIPSVFSGFELRHVSATNLWILIGIRSGQIELDLHIDMYYLSNFLTNSTMNNFESINSKNGNSK